MIATTQLKTTNSEEIFAAAQKLMPGGVSSPVRAFKSVGGKPIVFDRVLGAYIWDVDGNQYTDYVGSWGPAICGHTHPEVIAALHDALNKGTSFGAPCYLENVLAQMVIDAVPSIEMVRFVNSGTEACMAVLRLMRAFTGREKVIKFEGCYHGHADMFLVKAGSGIATLGLPDSPGVPKSVTSNTLTAPFNDLEAVRVLFEQNRDEIAGVIVEPVVGNAGFIPPAAGFLEGLRTITQQHGALLVFDEVMTGFRIAYGGAQEKFGVIPDLTTLGKVIGGGLPVGAYGGRQEIMSMVAPAGSVYQAGTLSGNPLAMTAGIKTLELLQQPGTYEYLDGLTKQLAEGMLEIAKETGHAAWGGHISGMFGFFFNQGPVRNYEDAKKSDLSKFARFHRGMLEHGVYLAPSQFEAGFTSLAHTKADIDRTLEAARAVCFSSI
ncbi:glutamate-1-semialdehyde aminotransferase [Nostoc linckia z18]|uniref:Glutamate-1-semialdehyde 2,1-aminomutase n=2 Tax=Nostoc linckia TaxID=92942 RepID=A0A9Q6EIA3_NOSLI|nr:glutamate-1-semialdehyde aminotransferase [Nostoc linckia z1]PHJ70903.1 glutamate-1-semialdehyde aminotransferase [Nostoc linckia z3]PHJ74173.1 glutamate-1-semialdehyde aminotransferase [Nostoc linckia z2]PHJ75656.1 glutamate-1-semialdehyde aminotransferase [Nostoc linckia z4]PHJ87567.1 glutamate-1-semialdehyde aminotransferase [Nostoc linckia z6]PHJ88611.1 glutamate-1-semialdehyde aminotransferase [Nostoc linckia z7]PHJ94844.1 glutamate-1-semialdehyde aminotransferase [Nostoc linckia z8]